LSIEDVPEPHAGPGEVILKVAYCGICGSDLHVTQPGAMLMPAGSILGHEFSGEIADSRSASWKPGDRVAAIPLWECASCAPHGCRKGLGALCRESCFQGVAPGVAGAYAQYVTLRESQIVGLPPEIGLRDGALLEPLAVGAHAVAEAGSLADQRVLILGAGPIGLTTAMSARLAGARTVVVSELSEVRRERAKAAGVDGVVDPKAGKVGDAFADIAGGRPDVIFECVGVPGMIQQAVHMSGPRGRVIVVGACMVEDSFLPAAAMSKEIRMHFVLGYTRADFERVVGHLAGGRIDGDTMISDIIGFDALPRVFEELRTPNAHCKVLIAPNGRDTAVH
jgi:2-desacetyl-2-hydroxyethyl bacteriochlorophyllide A dehydrogenase